MMRLYSSQMKKWATYAFLAGCGVLLYGNIFGAPDMFGSTVDSPYKTEILERDSMDEPRNGVVLIDPYNFNTGWSLKSFRKYSVILISYIWVI